MSRIIGAEGAHRFARGRELRVAAPVVVAGDAARGAVEEGEPRVAEHLGSWEPEGSERRAHRPHQYGPGRATAEDEARGEDRARGNRLQNGDVDQPRSGGREGGAGCGVEQFREDGA